MGALDIHHQPNRPITDQYLGEYVYLRTPIGTYHGLVEHTDWDYTSLRPSVVWEPVDGEGTTKARIEERVPTTIATGAIHSVSPLESKESLEALLKPKEKSQKKE